MSDPGWGKPIRDEGFRSVLRILVPGFGIQGSAGGGLDVLRGLFLALFIAPFLILFVLTFVFDEVGSPSGPIALAVVAIGIGALAGVSFTQRRNIEDASPKGVAAMYRTTFFLGFALSEVVALIGFVFCFLEDAMWPYFFALPFFVVGMVMIAPTRGNLEKWQRRITAQGSSTSIVEALDEPIEGSS